MVVLLPWGQVIEDYLDTIGLGLDDFVDAIDGGWMFGFVDALATAGISTSIVWPSRNVTEPQRRTHHRTGIPVWFIPPTRTWRVLRRAVDDPYAVDPADAAPGRTRLRRWLAAAAHTALPWVATPVRGVRRVLRAEHADVLLCQEYEEARFDTCVAARRVLGVPVYAVFQGGILRRTPLERLTRPRAIRAADGLVIGASTEARRVAKQYAIAPDRVSLVPNPLPLDDWPLVDRAEARRALGIAEGAGVVSWHGRVMMAQKGLDVLLDAWEQVTAARPGRELVLLMTGSGNDSGRLHAELDRRALRGVEWRDEYVLDRDAIRQRLAAADVAVLSSRAEGFAVAPLEAMASGRALVAAAVPGVHDLAPAGEEDGVIVVGQGDPAALAGALGELLDDPARAGALGAAARARVAAAFSLEAVGEELAARFELPDGRSTPARTRRYPRRPRRGAEAGSMADATGHREHDTESRLRRALTKVARRTGRFLGVTDLSRSVDAARERLEASRTELTEVADELRRRVQMLEEEQLRLQQARAVWASNTYLAATPIPEDALISVILPTRNRAHLVGRAVESVLAQSYANWELVVVVDGSDDGTSRVLEGFDDPRVHVLDREHGGQAAARNAGVDKASGEYVVYLDDDNVMYEHWLRGVAWAFIVHPHADVMIGARVIDDEFRGRHLPGGGPPHLSYIDALDRAALREGNQADLMQLAHRRSIPERFDADESPYEDWGFLARITRDRDPVCFPALAGIYTTTAPGRLMDSDREALARQVRRVQTKLG